VTVLFDLDDFEETRVEWEPIFGEDGLCRDCGIKTAFNQGGARPGLGLFVVCNGCAGIDGCREQHCSPVIERRARPDFTVDEVAHCPNCSWFILDGAPWEDEPYTADDLMDMLAEHARPRHVSRWGESHLIAEHDQLVADQAERRARYVAYSEREVIG